MDHLGYYKTLGVSESSSYHDIRKAYRRLVKKHHPDRNASSHSGDMIKKINAAFEIIWYKEWRHERFGDRQSTRIRKDPSVTTGVSKVEDDAESSKPRARFNITVEPTLCMAFGSCEVLAPKVFVLEKNKIINPKVRIESEDGASFEDILSAAETCPTKAIRIVDRHSGEQVFP